MGSSIGSKAPAHLQNLIQIHLPRDLQIVLAVRTRTGRPSNSTRRGSSQTAQCRAGSSRGGGSSGCGGSVVGSHSRCGRGGSGGCKASGHEITLLHTAMDVDAAFGEVILQQRSQGSGHRMGGVRHSPMHRFPWMYRS